MSGTPDHLRARELNYLDRCKLGAELRTAAAYLELECGPNVAREYGRAIQWLRDGAAELERWTGR